MQSALEQPEPCSAPQRSSDGQSKFDAEDAALGSRQLLAKDERSLQPNHLRPAVTEQRCMEYNKARAIGHDFQQKITEKAL
jgi:hypothetical protein